MQYAEEKRNVVTVEPGTMGAEFCLRVTGEWRDVIDGKPGAWRFGKSSTASFNREDIPAMIAALSAILADSAGGEEVTYWCRQCELEVTEPAHVADTVCGYCRA